MVAGVELPSRCFCSYRAVFTSPQKPHLRMCSVRLSLLLILLAVFCANCRCASRHKKSSSATSRRVHRSKSMESKTGQQSVDSLVNALLATDCFNLTDFRATLNSISVPRHVNSNGHLQVRKFIESTLQSLGPNWHVEEDSFSDQTPLGRVKFRNIVGTYVPSSQLCGGKLRSKTERIMLACHYDSLHPSLVHKDKDSFDSSQFVGATDAAVSCSMLLSLAQFITPYLHKKYSRSFSSSSRQLTIQLVFFDGEEALLATQSKSSSTNKSKSNSLFGSRHLAQKWEYTLRNSNKTRSEKHRSKAWKRASKIRPKISRSVMKAMLRLCKSPFELLPMLPSLDTNTSVSTAGETLNRHKSQDRRANWSASESEAVGETLSELHHAYHTIANIRLFLLLDLVGGSSARFYNTNLQTSQHFRRLAQIEKYILSKDKVDINPSKPFFQTNPPFLLSLVRDDHLPFVVRNVSVLHLIPHPFPRIWHRLEDNLDKVNFKAIRRLLIVLQVFLLDSFNIS